MDKKEDIATNEWLSQYDDANLSCPAIEAMKIDNSQEFDPIKEAKEWASTLPDA